MMKKSKLFVIIFFLLSFSFLYILSLAYFGLQVSLLALMYFLFFEGFVIFLCTALIVIRNRSYRI